MLFPSFLMAAASEIPLKLNFQGNFTPGNVVIDFYIAGSANSSDRLPAASPWMEQLSTATADGAISYMLGTLNPLPKALFNGASTNRYLEVVVGGQSTFLELVSVPYAYRASLADELAGGTTVQGSLRVFGDSLHLIAWNDQLIFEEPDGIVDARKWIMKSNGSVFSLLTANDGFNQFAQVLGVSRTGVGVNSVVFPSGNVGIGTANPAFKLDVNGIVNAQDVYKNGVPFSGASQWDNVTGGINFSGGKVGVGASSPRARLHIQDGNDQMIIEDFDGAVDEKLWLLKADAGKFGFVSANDAFTAFDPVLQMVRSGVNVDQIYVPHASLGLGTLSPQGHLHIYGSGERRIALTRSDLANEPTFKLGQIILAGDGDPEFRFLYSDLATPERTVAEIDKKGIISSVKIVRGSHFEGFLAGDAQPFFRLNSFPAMQLEMGPGGAVATDVAVRRAGAGTMTFITGDTAGSVERMRIDANGNVGIGTTQPVSPLQVNGYLQISLTSGVPPAADCNEAAEAGRMKYDAGVNRIYICSGAGGWRTR